MQLGPVPLLVGPHLLLHSHMPMSLLMQIKQLCVAALPASFEAAPL